MFIHPASTTMARTAVTARKKKNKKRKPEPNGSAPVETAKKSQQNPSSTQQPKRKKKKTRHPNPTTDYATQKGVPKPPATSPNGDGCDSETNEQPWLLETAPSVSWGEVDPEDEALMHPYTIGPKCHTTNPVKQESDAGADQYDTRDHLSDMFRSCGVLVPLGRGGGSRLPDWKKTL